MIDTNALLGIAFSLIANLTNNVPLSVGGVPQSPSDLRRYIIGSPHSPTDVFLWTHDGCQFSIKGGVVDYFESPGSYFNNQDRRQIPKFAGTLSVTSDQAIQIASNALQHLCKTAGRLTNGNAKLEQAGLYQGERIPFFRVEWPKIRGGSGKAADVEIDGRTGRIVFLHLWDAAFFDLAYDDKIKELVYVTEPASSVQNEAVSLVSKSRLPQPTTNYVEQAIANWLLFSRNLGLDPGVETNTADLNWDRTWLYTNREFSVVVPVAQIRFRNGVCFESIDSVVYSHFSADACYTGLWDERSPAEWNRFRGKIVTRLEYLTRKLEDALVRKVAIPRELLVQFTAHFEQPELGSEGIKRVVVEWRNWPANPSRTVWISETKLGFAAEFDLETGELKWISFHDPRFIAALRQAQTESESRRAGQDATAR